MKSTYFWPPRRSAEDLGRQWVSKKSNCRLTPNRPKRATADGCPPWRPRFIAAIAQRSDSGFHEVMLEIVSVDQTQQDS